MKTLLLILGLIVFAMGLLWVGQGTGMVRWPASSGMIDQMNWAYYGGAAALLGLVVMWYSRKK